jgi:predicted nucleic acid-binding protein
MERCPRKVVVDASVVAKWFIPEHHSDRALRYRRDLQEEAVIECVSILCAFGMELEPPGPREIARAVGEATSRDLSVYDGSYISIAKKHATKVVTADAKLHLAGGGDDTLLIEDLGSKWELP